MVGAATVNVGERQFTSQLELRAMYDRARSVSS